MFQPQTKFNNMCEECKAKNKNGKKEKWMKT
jgi:hypothetical protein